MGSLFGELLGVEKFPPETNIHATHVCPEIIFDFEDDSVPLVLGQGFYFQIFPGLYHMLVSSYWQS